MPAPDKTEKPTSKRRRDARKEGSITKSPEIASWGLLLILSFIGPWIFRYTAPKIVEQFLAMEAVSRQQLTPGLALLMFERGLRIFAEVAGIVGAVGFVFAFVVTISQVGFVVVKKGITPQFSRLNPGKNIKKIFSSGGLFEITKQVIKITVVSGVAYMVIHSKVTELASGQLSLGASISDVVTGSIAILRTVAALGLVLGIADYFRQRHSMIKSLYMSKQEVKDEMKEAEGDPMVKGRIRRLQRQLARQRMLHLVPQADVVVVNPTHYAVALKYDPQRAIAPVVLAKGSGHLAARIKEIATENVVPIVRDPLLARTLHVTCKVGAEIPPAFFLAVARLLAFVYRLSGAARYYETTFQTPVTDLPDDAVTKAEAMV
ncbi:MAG: flagellar biosynthesis protein FlhB [Acidimicrobiales bacterium]